MLWIIFLIIRLWRQWTCEWGRIHKWGKCMGDKMSEVPDDSYSIPICVPVADSKRPSRGQSEEIFHWFSLGLISIHFLCWTMKIRWICRWKSSHDTNLSFINQRVTQSMECGWRWSGNGTITQRPTIWLCLILGDCGHQNHVWAWRWLILRILEADLAKVRGSGPLRPQILGASVIRSHCLKRRDEVKSAPRSAQFWTEPIFLNGANLERSLIWANNIHSNPSKVPFWCNICLIASEFALKSIDRSTNNAPGFTWPMVGLEGNRGGLSVCYAYK